MHTIFRPTEFFETYRLMGVETIISVAFYPITPKYSDSLEDLFRWMIEREPRRLKTVGISGFCGIGIHPRAIPISLNPKIYDIIEGMLQSPNVVCLGEIGLEKGTKQEIEVLEKQLNLAKKNEDVPVILHTPGKNKREVTKKIMEILENTNIKNGIIDHVSLENIDLVLNSNLYIGLTVQLGKLTIEKFLDIIHEYEDYLNRFIINSDLGMDIADKYIVPKVIQRLVENKLEQKNIEKISHENAENLFKIL